MIPREERTKTADRSGLLGTIERSVRTSRLWTTLRKRSEWLRSVSPAANGVFETSILAGRVRDATVALSRARANSRIANLIAALVGWSRSSVLYRWLTKEPEPDVIVIDLRDTWTLGPILAVLDRLVDGLLASAPTSVLHGVVEVLGRRTREAPVRVASVVVLVLVVTNLVVSLVLGGPGRIGLLARLAIVAGALLGSRDRRSWPELRETRPVRLLVAVLEPPAPPESEPSDESDDREDG